MKSLILPISFIFLLININCNHQSKNESTSPKTESSSQQSKIEKIQLTEQTRGSNTIITYTPASKVSSYNGEESNSPMSASEWGKITKQAEAIDLSKISTLQSPTTDRYTDRALIATIIITSNGTTYTSASFDSGKPPKELEELYNSIQPLKKVQKRKF